MRNYQITFALSSFLFLLLSFSSCTTESISYDCSAIAPTYTNDVKSIMDANCAYSGCHDVYTNAHGINLSTYAAVLSESSNARFMGSMHHEGGYDRMPEGASQLNTSDLQKVYCWIQSGAPQ
jgi:hypothetical protein